MVSSISSLSATELLRMAGVDMLTPTRQPNNFNQTLHSTQQVAQAQAQAQAAAQASAAAQLLVQQQTLHAQSQLRQAAQPTATNAAAAVAVSDRATSEAQKRDQATVSHSTAAASSAADATAAKAEKVASTVTAAPASAKASLNTSEAAQQGMDTAATTAATTTTTTAASTGSGTAFSAVSATTASLFNSRGNLETGGNIKDFKILGSQQMLMAQAIQANKIIGITGVGAAQIAATVQPAIMAQLGLVQKLYEMLTRTNVRLATIEDLLAVKSQSAMNSTQMTLHDEMLLAQQQSQVLSLVYLERLFQLFEYSKNLALSRFFKKGPLGDSEHDENTDDEYGSTYTDLDAETDYIKRPRKENPEMAFHEAMLT